MNKELLKEGLEILNISLSDYQMNQLATFEKEITLFNDVYRLVNAKDDELIIKHFLDSLAPLPIIKELIEDIQKPVRCADIGSGGGFPAIPLSILLEDTHWNLIERSKKRCGFLENVVASCNLYDRSRVLDKDLKEVHEQYDLITCRAFASIHDILSSLKTIVTPRGVICAYKGKIETTLEEFRAVGNVEGDDEKGILGPFSYMIKPVKVPFLDASRHLLLLSLHGEDGR